MEKALQQFFEQGLQNACGWTTAAKMTWFSVGALAGVAISVIVAYLFKRKEKK